MFGSFSWTDYLDPRKRLRKTDWRITTTYGQIKFKAVVRRSIAVLDRLKRRFRRSEWSFRVLFKKRIYGKRLKKVKRSGKHTSATKGYQMSLWVAIPLPMPFYRHIVLPTDCFADKNL
jgi:hypothetical protein